jgi:hypothetical protein
VTINFQKTVLFQVFPLRILGGVQINVIFKNNFSVTCCSLWTEESLQSNIKQLRHDSQNLNRKTAISLSFISFLLSTLFLLYPFFLSDSFHFSLLPLFLCFLVPFLYTKTVSSPRTSVPLIPILPLSPFPFILVCIFFLDRLPLFLSPQTGIGHNLYVNFFLCFELIDYK